MSTYPRTYDLIHADSVFSLYSGRFLTANRSSYICHSLGKLFFFLGAGQTIVLGFYYMELNSFNWGMILGWNTINWTSYMHGVLPDVPFVGLTAIATENFQEDLKKELGREPTDAELAEATNNVRVKKAIQIGRAARNKLIKILLLSRSLSLKRGGEFIGALLIFFEMIKSYIKESLNNLGGYMLQHNLRVVLFVFGYLHMPDPFTKVVTPIILSDSRDDDLLPFLPETNPLSDSVVSAPAEVVDNQPNSLALDDNQPSVSLSPVLVQPAPKLVELAPKPVMNQLRRSSKHHIPPQYFSQYKCNSVLYSITNHLSYYHLSQNYRNFVFQVHEPKLTELRPD
ncbi:hypothetical protein RIF29_33219 [Crotalaria pallida]|uniref:Uncharacterized protein n=1 Tax=Crotalaria pallida TaxID=3830 RepID=A0AAN9HQK6_CROPI